MRLSIVMPVLNHVYYTIKAVTSLMRVMGAYDWSLIMVDDGSTDDTMAYAIELQRHLGDKRFHYHKNVTNLGVNASWNVGVNIAVAQVANHIAIVNNDIEFAPEWEDYLFRELRDPTVGVVSPMHTTGALPNGWPDGQTWLRNPGGLDILGEAFMFRRDLFNAIGPFPETMRTYFGDNWIVMMSKKLGLRCFCVPDSHIHHHVSQTTVALDQNEEWGRDVPAWKAECDMQGTFDIRSVPSAWRSVLTRPR